MATFSVSDPLNDVFQIPPLKQWPSGKLNHHFLSQSVTAVVVDHQGPVSTYMTSCNGDCTTFSTVGTKWFKIDASGYENGQWAATKLIASRSKV